MMYSNEPLTLSRVSSKALDLEKREYVYQYETITYNQCVPLPLVATSLNDDKVCELIPSQALLVPVDPQWQYGEWRKLVKTQGELIYMWANKQEALPKFVALEAKFIANFYQVFGTRPFNWQCLDFNLEDK